MLLKKNLDLLFILLLFITGFTLAQHFQQTQTIAKPSFFQAYFEPAVMLTCGHGFNSTQGHAGSELENFLNLKQNTYSCSSLPTQLNLRQDTRMRAWYYMMITTAAVWKITGISWSAINIIGSILFGLTICAAFAIYRLGMYTLLAALGAGLFALAPSHQFHLLSLRDYSKAPFFLFGIFILSFLVIKPTKLSTKILLIITYGIITGIGYGFRPDVILLLPPLFITLVFFIQERWFTKVILLLLGCASFIIAAAPMLLAFHAEKMGSCIWHFSLLGLMSNFSQPLGLTQPIYSWSYKFSDEMTYAMVSAYATHFLHMAFSTPPCSSLYDLASGALLKNIFINFPADMLIRGYAASLALFRQGYCLSLTIAAILVIGIFNLRIAFFIFLMLFYFFSYTAVQFAPRHYFHLSFFYWLPLGLFISLIIRWRINQKFWQNCLSSLLHPNKQIVCEYRSKLFKSIGFFVFIFIVLSGLLYSARLYQSLQVTHIIKSYLNAAQTPLTTTRYKHQTKDLSLFQFDWPQNLVSQFTHIPAHGNLTTAKMLHIKVGGPQCAYRQLNLRLVYDTRNPYYDFAAPMGIQTQSSHYSDIYLPLYFISGDLSQMGSELMSEAMTGYAIPFGVELPSSQSSCIVAFTLVNTEQLQPSWLILFLPYDWQQQPLYQQLL